MTLYRSTSQVSFKVGVRLQIYHISI